MEVAAPHNELAEVFNNNTEQGKMLAQAGDLLEREAPPKMTSSVASILDDTTPSDSGVQLLDSESSGLNESMISSAGGFEFDVGPVPPPPAVPGMALALEGGGADLHNNNNEQEDVVEETGKFVEIDIRGEVEEIDQGMTTSQIPDELISSTCSTFDSENIVYRRRIKKTPISKTPKKRVSFHEDILKNTKTDNIHIEHGFITYKTGAGKKVAKGRYSWCTEDDGGFDYGDEEAGENRQYVYRNACSDVLDYGKTDVFENIEDERNYVKYDNSGIFEYGPPGATGGKPATGAIRKKNGSEFYKCSCSDSNSSLDSGEGNETNYKQAKSNSCECIGANNTNNNNIISDNCYYSEPNIEHLDEYNGNAGAEGEHPVKSVWSKEKKPKSSCLKKTKRNIYTNVVPEYDLNKKMKKFNVHHLSVLDNSKMIFGSLKDIFGISLPERGVPEGSEDLSTVAECIPESNDNMIDDFTVVQKPKNFLSKSLDGGFNGNDKNRQKKYVHNVDEQLRRKNDEDLYAPSRKNSVEDEEKENKEEQENQVTLEPLQSKPQTTAYRNKFIINGESTVFEHTGVSYCYDDNQSKASDDETLEKDLLVGENTGGSFIGKTQIKKKLSNIFQKINVIGSTASTPVSRSGGDGLDTGQYQKLTKSTPEPQTPDQPPEMDIKPQSVMESSTISSCSSDHSDSTASKPDPKIYSNLSSPRGSVSKNRHLSSPLRKKSLTTRLETRNRMSPDLFNLGSAPAPGRHLNIDRSLLSEEFDDILTVTTTTTTATTTSTANELEKTMEGNDIVILDYPSTSFTPTPPQPEEFHPKCNILTPSHHPFKHYHHHQNPMTSSASSTSTSKSSLINRFLRNVTQKKILEATIKQNSFFQSKLNHERKLFENLFPRGVRSLNRELIEDLNAEIAMEIELSSSACQLDRIQLNDTHTQTNSLALGDIKFDGGGVGVGELSIEMFNVKRLHIYRNESEILMKVFKLFNGYSREGHMTPVLVFLTDKTLYVTDQVRNRLCNKFVLPYSELDVILVGPYGNTVLLSNSARDMQQVLLAGGPYPAEGLVSSLELCARRGGSTLPAVGQLTLDHLTPLQAFARDNSTVYRDDSWKYYAVVNVPAGTLGVEEEPLGPHIKGPLMHRRMSHAGFVDNWSAGYFLLKAGVLYLFADATQKLPTWAVALAECQGARRSLHSGRPYCFELLLRTGALQLAAPDEYVASDWLQALVQAASGLFEIQERRRTLGCTLVLTSNHLLTLREDFSAPLRRNTTNGTTSAALLLSPSKENINPNAQRKLSISTMPDNVSEISSNRSNGSTPTRTNLTAFDRRSNSSTSTPTKSSIQGGTSGQTHSPARYSRSTGIDNSPADERSHTNMSSFYGKNSGVEVLTCASIEEMSAVKIPAISSNWWCILEFECQEVRENSDDLVVFFSTNTEQERFLSMLESIWHAKKDEPFPASIITSDDMVYEHCSKLFQDINRSWEPLLSAALGYPQ